MGSAAKPAVAVHLPGTAFQVCLRECLHFGPDEGALTRLMERVGRMGGRLALALRCGQMHEVPQERLQETGLGFGLSNVPLWRNQLTPLSQVHEEQGVGAAVALNIDLAVWLIRGCDLDVVCHNHLRTFRQVGGGLSTVF